MNRDDGEVDKVQSRERAAIGRTFLRRQMGGPATLEESAEKLKGLKLHRQAGRWDCPNEVSCPSACLAFRWSLSPFMFSRIPERRRGIHLLPQNTFFDTGFFLLSKLNPSSPCGHIHHLGKLRLYATTPWHMVIWTLPYSSHPVKGVLDDREA